NEVIPTLDLPKDDLNQFAADVTERFSNPFVDHQLLSISLNSTSKWKARCMPSLLEYSKRKNGAIAPCLAFSFAAYICFYHNGTEKGDACLHAARENGDAYDIKDDEWVLDFYYEHRNDSLEALADAVIDNEKMWDDSLKNLPGFRETVKEDLALIEKKGMKAAMADFAVKA
ncbi:MAG: tagaturonate reductase, partial [Lachnospiraceae bacterium]|nr:tagaturonate reductase [Lachnospiraceae bacterium]